MLIIKVRSTKQGQKLVTIPKNSDIQVDDYIEINKVKSDLNEITKPTSEQ